MASRAPGTLTDADNVVIVKDGKEAICDRILQLKLMRSLGWKLKGEETPTPAPKSEPEPAPAKPRMSRKAREGDGL